MIHRSPVLILILLTVPLACGDDGGTDSGTDGGTASTTGDIETTGGTEPTGTGSSTGLDPAQFYGCAEQAFMASPLAGPGYDAAKGGIQGALQGEYVVHTTQIYIRPDKQQEFGTLAQAISAEAAKIEGLIAFSVGSDAGCGVARTMGIWASEEAMYKLVTSEAHAQAMAATTALSFTGRVTHWTVPAAEANAYTWEVARARIGDVEPSAIY